MVMYMSRHNIKKVHSKSSQIMDSFCGSNTREGSQVQNYNISHHLRRAVLLFNVVTLTCLVLYQSSYSPFELYRQSISSLTSDHSKNCTTPGNGERSLNRALEKAAMSDNTVIITTLNEAWIEQDSVFDLFLESFRIGNQTLGLLKHLMVVTLDKKAFDHWLGTLHLNCYHLTTEGVNFSFDVYFNTRNYVSMMWRRIDFLRSVLEMGYSFVFTDADIMWLRNPFPHFHSDANFQISCDYFQGHPADLNNSPNGGFVYVKSSKQTIKFYKFWYRSRACCPKEHDQHVLDKIKHDPSLGRSD